MQMGSNIETSAPNGIPLIDYEECLVERKWWCFLLSSIFTFVLGLISVIATRLVQTYLCIGSEETVSDEEKQRIKDEAKKAQTSGPEPRRGPRG